METKINKRIGFDNMSIKGTLPSGAMVRFAIGRSGEKIEAGLSNDPIVMKQQFATLKQWLEIRKGETNLDRFERLEKVLRASKTSAELIANLNNF